MSKPVVLITGGAGFIGGFLTKNLLDSGFYVRVFDNLITGSRKNVPEDADLIIGDIEDFDAVYNACLGVDSIIHLAGHVSVRDSLNFVQKDIRINLLGTTNVILAAQKCGVGHFIYASSMAVYSEPLGGRALSENSPTWPLSPYGADKLASEVHTVSLCNQSNIKWCILRIFNVYGEQQRLSNSVGIVRMAIDAIYNQKALPLFGYGLHIRDFIHVSDVVNAFRIALQSECSGIFNIGTGRGVSLLELVAFIEDIVGQKINKQLLPYRDEELRFAVADTTKAKRLLGFRADISLEDGLRQVIDYYCRDYRGQ